MKNNIIKTIFLSIISLVLCMTASADPSEIAYASQPGGFATPNNIFTLITGTTNKKQITFESGSNERYYSPEWSPNGKYLAFLKETCSQPGILPGKPCGGEFYDIIIEIVDLSIMESYPDNIVHTLSFYDPDTGAAPEGTHMSSFSFSPDGNKIVAIVTNGIYTGLAIFDVSQGTLDNYVQSPEYWMQAHLEGSAPSCSPKENLIAYACYWADPETEYAPDIFLMSTSGNMEYRLTNDVDSGYSNIQPSWSPDGEQILFTSNRDGGRIFDIWVMDKSGYNKTKILDCKSGCFSPVFSTDGETIFFETAKEIFSIRRDGSGLTRITYTGAGSPSCSP